MLGTIVLEKRWTLLYTKIKKNQSELILMKFDINSLSVEDLVGQVLCPSISAKDDPAEVEKMLMEKKPGGFFVTHMSKEMIKRYTDVVNKYSKVPVIVCSDVENGPEIVIDGAGYFPKPMACGAADSPELLREATEAAAAICRKNGVHWTFAPVVDINYNFRCPEINTRAFSDDPKQVSKMSKAFIKGIQKDNNMVACVKHFPGQGTDERNAHFCTTVNDMTREEWMETYGYVYKEAFKEGVGSVMIAHCALPFCEEDVDPNLGCPPAILSKSIMTDLLKNELGFEGCVVSDAMSMVGAVARCPLDKLAVNFLKAGGDMVLFDEKSDRENILKAVESGELPLERLRDAVTRIVRMKEWVGLFENQEKIEKNLKLKRPISEVSTEIAERSITLQRNYENLIPLNIPEKSKILFVNVVNNRHKQEPTGHEFDVLKEEFEKEGYTVDVLTTPYHYEFEKTITDYEAVLINYKLDVDRYHGGTFRVGWDNIFHFWRGYIFNAKRLICTSFGDPYKLFDLPFLKTYLNAYSSTEESQRAAARVILGKIPALGKNPVELKGFFEREV